MILSYISKENGKYCVRSKKNPEWHGGCYDSEKEAKERLKQVEMFKHMEGQLKVLSTRFYRKGMTDLSYKIRNLLRTGERDMHDKNIKDIVKRLEDKGRSDLALQASEIFNRMSKEPVTGEDDTEKTVPEFMNIKLKKSLGPEMTDIFQGVGEAIYDNLKKAFRNSTADVLRSARKELEVMVKDEYGNHGVTEAREHIPEFYSGLIGSITGDLSDLVADIMAEEEQKVEPEIPEEMPEE